MYGQELKTLEYNTNYYYYQLLQLHNLPFVVGRHLRLVSALAIARPLHMNLTLVTTTLDYSEYAVTYMFIGFMYIVVVRHTYDCFRMPSPTDMA